MILLTVRCDAIHTDAGTASGMLQLMGGSSVNTLEAESTWARSRKLQADVERLLPSLVLRAQLVPEGAHQIRDSAAMPDQLRIVAALALKNGRAWSCWTYGLRTWLFTAEMLLALSRERGVPVLHVDLFDDYGPKDSGLWAQNSGEWQRCDG